MKRYAWYGALALLMGMPVHAWAEDGYVTGNVTLRAGPDIDYPSIDMIPAGAPVGIEGCTEGWEWCDVMFGNERGWVAGNFIQDEYGNQQVLVPAYGERLGIPIVTFSITNYWDRYYVSRPFYRERERWYHRPPPHHAPPPPSRRPMPHPERRDDSRWRNDRNGGQAAPLDRQAAPAHAPPYAPIHRASPRQQALPRDQESHSQRPTAAVHTMPAPHGGQQTPARPPENHGATGHPAGADQDKSHRPSGHDKDERPEH
jgi:uncharacterized protein YraI